MSGVSKKFKAENLKYVFRDKINNGAEFTVKSTATGKDFTFSINRSLYNERWYTHVYVEKEYMNFVRLGTYANGYITNKHVLVQTPAADAIAWILRKVESGKFDELDAKVDLMHLGKCLVCGRPLTDAISIEHGVGPVCRTFK